MINSKIHPNFVFHNHTKLNMYTKIIFFLDFSDYKNKSLDYFLKTEPSPLPFFRWCWGWGLCLADAPSLLINWDTVPQLLKQGMTSGRKLTWSLHPAVVIGVNAHLFLLGAKWELTALQRLQLVMGLEIRPAPHAAVNNMGQTLAVGHLQPPIQRPGNCHTFAGLPWTAEGPLQLIHGSFLLLQFLH